MHVWSVCRLCSTRGTLLEEAHPALAGEAMQLPLIVCLPCKLCGNSLAGCNLYCSVLFCSVALCNLIGMMDRSTSGTVAGDDPGNGKLYLMS